MAASHTARLAPDGAQQHDHQRDEPRFLIDVRRDREGHRGRCRVLVEVPVTGLYFEGVVAAR